MRFIDLFNSAKNTAVFEERTRNFKSWCYLAKKNPEIFTVRWDKHSGQFALYQYLESESCGFDAMAVEKQENNYKTMGDFKR